MLYHAVEIGILNVIEFASYQYLHLVWVLFYDPYILLFKLPIFTLSSIRIY